MNDDRLKILQMLGAGQLTAEEAEALIAALEKGPTESSPAESPAPPKPRPRYLRVVVESGVNPEGEAPHQVNIRVPMQLLRAGVRLASLIPAGARDRVNDALRKDGVAFDINQLKPENLEALIDHLDDLVVDVDHHHKKSKVKLYCE